MKIIIPLQTPSQKNSKSIAINQRTKKPFIMTNKNVQNWKNLAQNYLQNIELIEGSISIDVIFYNKDKRKRDLDNMFTSLADLLKNNNIIEDDNCFILQKISSTFGGVDKENPRAEITITKI